jgi:hypothetical protein
MKYLLFALCFLSLSAFSQTKGFVLPTVQLASSNRTGGGVGGNITGDFALSKGFYFGASVGAIKFKNLPKAYLPIAMDLTYLFKSGSNVNPVLQLQPGYGIYSDSYGTGINKQEMKGGFTVYVSGGIKTGPFVLQLGYRSIGLEEPAVVTTGSSYQFVGKSTNYSAVEFRFGLLLH